MDSPHIRQILLQHDLITENTTLDIQALSGGVSSDIHLVRFDGKSLVFKQALTQLKVKDEWLANPSRNRFEQLFFLYAHQIDPMLVPALIISDPEEGYFAMEYLDGYKMWKKELLIGEFGAGRASQAAIILAKIHVAGRENTSLERQFDSHPNFFELRLDPYLLSTAKRHKDLKDVLTKEATRLAGWRETVVHGDFSPKNIMIRDERMVLLDHEVAHFGDPAFDVAFMLCHLFLKSLLHPDRLPDWRKMIYEFWEQYFHMATAGRPDDLQARSQHLTLLLLLARVDGKSPVEYLHEKSKEHDFIRSFVYQQMGKRQPFEQTLEDWTLALQSENPD